MYFFIFNTIGERPPLQKKEEYFAWHKKCIIDHNALIKLDLITFLSKGIG